MSSTFKATARRNGNSIAITITKGVAEGLGIKIGDAVLVEISKVGEKEDS